MHYRIFFLCIMLSVESMIQASAWLGSNSKKTGVKSGQKDSVVVGDKTGDIMRSIQFWCEVLAVGVEKSIGVTNHPLDDQDTVEKYTICCGRGKRRD